MAYRNQSVNYGWNNSVQRGAGARNMGNMNASCNGMESFPVQDVTAVCPDTVKKDELHGMPLAMAYVPWQQFENLYCLNDGFKQGTLFMDLNLDFYGRRCN